MAPITASVLFDPAYIEPALLTAFELRSLGTPLDSVVLVLLEDSDEDVAEARELVARFCQRMAELPGLPCRAISARGGIERFDAYHFSASILYKALLPSLVDVPGLLLNVDAGILPGGRFVDCLEQALANLEGQPDWVIAAHCHDPEGRMPAMLDATPRHALYPAGNLLLFNPAAYRAAQWQARFELAYRKHRADLKYAEQELICLVAQPAELQPLPWTEQRDTPFLGIERLTGELPMEAPKPLSTQVFYKVVGSIKPWKYWVLDPAKQRYLRHRARLEAVFPMAANPLVHKHRQSCMHQAWALGFQQAYEHHLLHSRHVEAAS